MMTVALGCMGGMMLYWRARARECSWLLDQIGERAGVVRQRGESDAGMYYRISARVLLDHAVVDAMRGGGEPRWN